MDDSRLAKLQDAMDKLWFQQNILFYELTSLSLQSFNKRTDSSSSMTSICATPLNSASQSSPASLSDKSNQLNNEEKRPTQLDIVLRQPLFQLHLQMPARSKSNLCSRPSSPSIDTSPRTKGRRVHERIRVCKSSSELENYELEGCMDLGFVFHSEKLSPQMINILPGLQRLGGEAEGSEEKREANERRVIRPYLSEAWLINRSSLPLLDEWMLPKSLQGANIKSRLRFWAREVASLVHEEPRKKTVN